MVMEKTPILCKKAKKYSEKCVKKYFRVKKHQKILMKSEVEERKLV